MIGRYFDELKAAISDWKARILGTFLASLAPCIGIVLTLIVVALLGILSAVLGSGVMGVITAILYAIAIFVVCSLAMFPVDYSLSYTMDNSVTIGQAFGSLFGNIKNYVNIMVGLWWTMILKMLPLGIVGLVIQILAGVVAMKSPGIGIVLGVVAFIVAIANIAINIKYLIGLNFYATVKLMHPDMKRTEAAEASQGAMAGHMMDIIIAQLVLSVVCSLFLPIPIVGIIAQALLLNVTASMNTKLYLEFGGEGAVTSQSSVQCEDDGTVKPKKKQAQKQVEQTQNIEDDFDDGSRDTFGNDISTPSFEDDMVRAIQGAYVTNLTHDGKTEIALPIDIVVKNGQKVYNFFVKTADGVKPIQVPETSITGLTVRSNRFNPQQYVTWTPKWNIPREWGI